MSRFMSRAGLLAAALLSFAAPSQAQNAVRVGMLPNNPPYSTCDRATNSNHQGATIELFTAVASDAGLTVEPYCDFVQAALTAAAVDGTVDVRLNNCNYEGLVCSEPFTTGFIGMTVPASDTTNYTSLGELRGKAVGTIAGNPQVEGLADAGVTVREYPDFISMMNGIVAGEIQAAFSNGGAAAYRINVLNQYPGVRFVDGFKATEAEYAFGLGAANTELLMRVNASLAKLKADGTVAEILARWGLEPI